MMMKKLSAFSVLIWMLLFQPAHADTMRDFVRIACVPETGLLDVEYRALHDSVAWGPETRNSRDAVLAQAGFHDPHGLQFSCRLGAVTYTVSAKQDEGSERMCGGVPEVYVTVTRDGRKLLSDVVFGQSCRELPSVMRITVGDGPNSWRGRETQVCYATSKDGDPHLCDWTFGDAAGFDKRFPIDQERLQKIVTRQERR